MLVAVARTRSSHVSETVTGIREVRNGVRRRVAHTETNSTRPVKVDTVKKSSCLLLPDGWPPALQLDRRGSTRPAGRRAAQLRRRRPSTKYSPLMQINKDNVKDRCAAWRWSTADRPLRLSHALCRQESFPVERGRCTMWRNSVAHSELSAGFPTAAASSIQRTQNRHSAYRRLQIHSVKRSFSGAVTRRRSTC